MRVDLRCRRCQAKLSVKAELQGKSIPCPKCRNLVEVTLAPVVLPQFDSARPASVPLAARASRLAKPVEEPMWAEVVPDTADFDVVTDEPPALPTPSSLPSAEEEPAPRPKKKNRKKKFKVSEETSVPVWMWLILIFGGLFTTAGLIFGIYLALRVGTPDGQPVAWREHLFIFGIGLPITLVILILSMFISSALGGGINFGDAKTAIIGSLFLIVIVNLVNLIPIVGRYLTLLVWLIGFMTIFGLDPWEARFLLFINWVMNYAIGLAIFYYMANKYDLGGDDDNQPVRSRSRDRQRKQKKEDPDDSDGMGYYQPSHWHDRMGVWVEAQRRVTV